METEHAQIAKMADWRAADLHPEGVGGVIQKFQVVAPGDIGQRVELAGMAVDVDGENSGRPWGDGSFYPLRV